VTEPHPADEFVIGGPIGRIKVSVRVIGDDLDPAEVTRLFGVEPTFAARRGEARERHGRPIVQRTGVWFHALTVDPTEEWELADAVDTLLARLPADPAIWRALGSRYQLDVFCGLFLRSENQGADLPPATLAALAERGLTLGLDIYGPF
jgi:hypothetical protein